MHSRTRTTSSSVVQPSAAAAAAAAAAALALAEATISAGAGGGAVGGAGGGGVGGSGGSPSDANSAPNLELFLSCVNLRSMDLASPSDPFVVVWSKHPITHQWMQIGRTETMENEPNPSFRRSIKLLYKFEEPQELRFDVFDQDATSRELIGSVDTLLSKVVCGRGDDPFRHALFDSRGRCAGDIVVRAAQIQESTAFISWTISGSNIKRMDYFSQSDPYLKFYKLLSDKTQIEIHRTEVIRDSPNPQWQAFSLGLHSLCASDVHQPFVVKCFDYDSPSKSDALGEIQTSVADIMGDKLNNPNLITEAVKRAFDLVDPNSPDRTLGLITFDNVRVTREPTHFHFIRGGMKTNLMVAIDFSASNGDRRDPTSLHHLNPGKPNLYQKVIHAVGHILAPYDADQRFPLWGFGGTFAGATSPCFSLTWGDEVKGVAGLMQTYTQAVARIEPQRVCNFAPVIEQAARYAAARPFDQTSQNYSILLMITAGDIGDFDATVAMLRDASNLPLSIIIVGVGDESSYPAMKKLDGDDCRRVEGRDIVQFVPFKEMLHEHIAVLAREVLAELPQQILSFARARNLKPLAPPPNGATSGADGIASTTGQPGHHPKAASITGRQIV